MYINSATLTASIGVSFFITLALLATMDAEAQGTNAQTKSALAMPHTDWPTYGGPATGTQYSTLSQINRGNVHKLKIAWTHNNGDYSTGADGIRPTAFEVTPLHVNDKLFLCTAFNQVIALDAGSGKELWAFDPKMDLTNSYVGAHLCRGVAFWSEKSDESEQSCKRQIFIGTADGRLIAIDADSGKRCSGFGDNGEVDLNKFDLNGVGKIGITSPPAIFKDLVIIGNMSGSYNEANAPDGFIWAFNARTGEMVWSWNPIPLALQEKAGGANAWAPLSLDLERGMVFVPTTSPTPDPYGGNRESVPYSNSIVALEAETGQVIWHFQTVHHDLWDYDLPAQPTLVEISKDGVKIPAVAQITKMGFTFVLDRLTGKPLFPVEEKKVPQSNVPGETSSPTQPVPSLPAPFTRHEMRAEEAWGLTFWDRNWCRDKISQLRNDGLFTPPSFRGTLQLPGPSGGANWGGAAFEPDSNLLIVNAMNIAAATQLFRRGQNDNSIEEILSFSHPGEMKGTPYTMLAGHILSPLGIPCSPPPWGTLNAINLATGKTHWQVPLGRVSMLGPMKTLRKWGSPTMGGPIVTAGGLIFIASTLDSEIHAFDLQTGEELWSAKLPAPAMATPMTFESGTGAERRQYIVIAAGGHASFKTKVSDALVAFNLSD